MYMFMSVNVSWVHMYLFQMYLHSYVYQNACQPERVCISARHGDPGESLVLSMTVCP